MQNAEILLRLKKSLRSAHYSLRYSLRPLRDKKLLRNEICELCLPFSRFDSAVFTSVKSHHIFNIYEIGIGRYVIVNVKILHITGALSVIVVEK